MAMTFWLLLDRCSGTTSEHGEDGVFCTADDPLDLRGTPMTLPFTTGLATATILNPDDFEGDINGPSQVAGTPFACAEDGEIDASGGALTAAFTACDYHRDLAVPMVLSLGMAQTPGPIPTMAVAAGQAVFEETGDTADLPVSLLGEGRR
jgi:hypothetical protein